MSKKGAKFIDMFIYVFMANKNFPINEQVNDHVIEFGVPNCCQTKHWVLKEVYNVIYVPIIKTSA